MRGALTAADTRTAVPPAPDAGAGGAAQLHFRALFISDVHLGHPDCQAERLLELLRLTESDYLYLVGNVIDARRIQRRFCWHQSHNDVVQKVLRKARKGTRVTYLAGREDSALRHFLGVAFGGVEIAEEAVHDTANGRRLLVVHGSRYDTGAGGAGRAGRLLAVLRALAGRLFRLVPGLAGRDPATRNRPAADSPEAAEATRAFEDALVREARRRECDGVVCGHHRRAAIRDVGGVLYCNDGDWIESLTAIAELPSGELRLLDWRELERERLGIVPAPGEAHAHPDRH